MSYFVLLTPGPSALTPLSLRGVTSSISALDMTSTRRTQNAPAARPHPFCLPLLFSQSAFIQVSYLTTCWRSPHPSPICLAISCEAVGARTHPSSWSETVIHGRSSLPASSLLRRGASGRMAWGQAALPRASRLIGAGSLHGQQRQPPVV